MAESSNHGASPPWPVRVIMLVCLSAPCFTAYAVMMMASRDLAGPVVSGLVSVVALPVPAYGLFLLSGALDNILSLFNPTVCLSVNTSNVEIGKTIQIRWKITGPAHRISSVAISLHGMEYSEKGRRRILRNPFTIPQLFEKQAIYETTNPTEIREGTISWIVPDNVDPSDGFRNMKWRIRLTGRIRWWMDACTVLPLQIYAART